MRVKVIKYQTTDFVSRLNKIIIKLVKIIYNSKLLDFKFN